MSIHTGMIHLSCMSLHLTVSRLWTFQAVIAWVRHSWRALVYATVAHLKVGKSWVGVFQTSVQFLSSCHPPKTPFHGDCVCS